MALADAGHTQRANYWLGFLVATGFQPKDAPDAWEHVRKAHPADVIPALLSGETAAVLRSPDGSPPRGAPSMTLPARLNGEAPYCRSNLRDLGESKLPVQNAGKDAFPDNLPTNTLSLVSAIA